MISHIMHVLSICTIFLFAIGSAFGLIRYRRSNGKARLTTWFILSILCVDLLARYTIHFFENNLYFLSVSAVLEFIFLSILYQRYMHTKPRGWISLAIIGITLFLIIHLIGISLVPDLDKFQLYDRLIVDGFLMLMGLIYLKDALQSDSNSSRKDSVTNAIILLYLIVDLFVSLTINFMVNANLDLIFMFWLLRLILIFILHANLISILWHNGKVKSR